MSDPRKPSKEELAAARIERAQRRATLISRVVQVGQLLAAKATPIEISRWCTGVIDDKAGKNWTCTEAEARHYLKLAYQGWDREDADDKDLIRARQSNRRTAALIIQRALGAGDYNAATRALKLKAELEGTLEPAPIHINVGTGDLPSAVAAIRHAHSTLQLAISRGAIAPSVVDAIGIESGPLPPRDSAIDVDSDDPDEDIAAAAGGEGN